jgi:hypothetical protein
MVFSHCLDANSVYIPSFTAGNVAPYNGQLQDAIYSNNRVKPATPGVYGFFYFSNTDPSNGKYFSIKTQVAVGNGIRINGNDWYSIGCFMEIRKTDGRYRLYAGFMTESFLYPITPNPTAPLGKSVARPWTDGQLVWLIFTRTSYSVIVWENISGVWTQILELRIIADGGYGGAWDETPVAGLATLTKIYFLQGEGEVLSLQRVALKRLFDYSSMVILNDSFNYADGQWSAAGLDLLYASPPGDTALVVSGNALTVATTTYRSLYIINNTEVPDSSSVVGVASYFRFQYVSGKLMVQLPTASGVFMKINSALTGSPLTLSVSGKSETVVATYGTAPTTGQFVHVLAYPNVVKSHLNQHTGTVVVKVWVTSSSTRPNLGSTPAMSYDTGTSIYSHTAPAIASEDGASAKIDAAYSQILFANDLTELFAKDSAVFNGTPFIPSSTRAVFPDTTAVNPLSGTKTELTFFDFYDKVYR